MWMREGTGSWGRGLVAGGGDWSLVEGSGSWGRGLVAGGGEW